MISQASLRGRGGQQRQADPQEAERADLVQHADQQGAGADRRLGTGVGQPGVQRHQRRLDREGDGEPGEDPHLGGLGDLARRSTRSVDPVERARTAGCCSDATYSPITDASISRPPSSEYRKNFVAAYARRTPPNAPIRKYIGISMTSNMT